MADFLKRNVSNDELETILREHAQWLQTRDTEQPQGKRANLAYAILTGSKALRGADLRDANLRGAILDGADLRGCLLNGADIEETSFRRSDLRGADLSESQGFDTADLATARTDGVILQPLALRQQIDNLQTQIRDLSEAAAEKEHREQNADAENQQINILQQKLAETEQQAEADAEPYRQTLTAQRQAYRQSGKWRRLKANFEDSGIILPMKYEKLVEVLVVIVITTMVIVTVAAAKTTSVAKWDIAGIGLGTVVGVFSIAGMYAAIGSSTIGILIVIILSGLIMELGMLGFLFFKQNHIFLTFLCLSIVMLLYWVFVAYIRFIGKAIKRYQQTDTQRQDHTFSSQTHRRYRDDITAKNQEIKELKAKLAAEDIGLDKRIQAAKQTLAGALGNADDSIRKNKRAAQICGLLGGGLFVLDGMMLLAVVVYFIYLLFREPTEFATLAGSLKDIPAWLVVLFTFPLAATLLIANALLRHQNKLLDEVRHFSAMKHQVELYSGLLEASQHAAHSFGSQSQSEYVQETFSKIRDRLLLNDLPAGSPALKDDKDGHADLEKSIGEIVANAVKSSK